MTASSQSDGRRRLRIAFVHVHGADIKCHGHEQEGDQVSRLAEEVRQTFPSAEQNGVSLKQKAGFYQVARARVKLLEKFAGQDNDKLRGRACQSSRSGKRSGREVTCCGSDLITDGCYVAPGLGRVLLDEGSN